MYTDTSDVPQYGSVINNGKASQFESPDEDDLIDLQFSENLASQPYLSLGLTPPSQLSPDTSDMDFFPSMPPPVSAASVSSLNNSMGISVDGPFDDNAIDSSYMPEAVPVEQHRNQRMSKKSRLDSRLPTVLETETPPDSYHHRGPPEFSGSGQSGGIDDPSSFVFPSAYSSPAAHHASKRRSSPTKNKDGGVTVVQNDFAEHSQDIISHKPSHNKSQSDETYQKLAIREKEMREAARKEELARQKELLRLKKEEEERIKRESTQAKILRDYNGWRYDYDVEKNVEQRRAESIVLKQAAKFEAAAELAAEGSQSPGVIRQSMRRSSTSAGVQRKGSNANELSDPGNSIEDPIKRSHVQVTRL